MTSAASSIASTGMATPEPESARPSSTSGHDAGWNKALVEADNAYPAGGTTDWTLPQDAPMQGLTASGDAIMRQSAVAMTIGLVSPVVASASVQPTYGTPMPPASVEQPAAPAGTTKKALRLPAATASKIQIPPSTVPAGPVSRNASAAVVTVSATATDKPRASIEQPVVPAKKTETAVRSASIASKIQTPPSTIQAGPVSRNASGAAAALPPGIPKGRPTNSLAQATIAISALKTTIHAQTGHSVALAASAADTLSRVGKLAPNVVGLSADPVGARTPGDDSISLPPAPVRTGIVQLTGQAPLAVASEMAPAVQSSDLVARPLAQPVSVPIVQLARLNLPATVGAAEEASVSDLVSQVPPSSRPGIVQLTGLAGPADVAEPEEVRPTEQEPITLASDPPRATTAAEAGEREPIRLYAEWTEQGVKVWLGTDADQLPVVPVLAQQVQQWLAGQGERLLSLTCNGRDVTTEIEGGSDLASQSGESWAGRPLPRPASLSDRF